MATILPLDGEGIAADSTKRIVDDEAMYPVDRGTEDQFLITGAPSLRPARR